MIDIAFCFDDNLVEPFYATLTSLLSSRKYSHYHIYAFHEGRKKFKRQVEYIVNKIDPYSRIEVKTIRNPYKDGHEDHGITKGAYMRFQLPFLCPNLNRILYSDVDILFNDDLYDVWKLETNNEYLLCARGLADIAGWNEDVRTLDYFSGMDRKRYINSGFMLMNLEELRHDKDLYVKWSKMVSNEYHYVDQDIINLTCADRISFLPDRYNYRMVYNNEFYEYALKSGYITDGFGDRSELRELVFNPAIIHYAGPDKPWLKYRRGKYNNIWWKYYCYGKKMAVESLLSKLKVIPGKKRKKEYRLDRLEYQLVDHCNLNCEGCTHYSNIAPETFADPEDFLKDIKELSKKISFKEIKLLGGEPLLHENPEKFVLYAREAYPKSKIIFTTNGILIPKIEDNVSFWTTLSDCKAEIHISVYPPFRTKAQEWSRLVRKRGIKCTLVVQNSFWRSRNPQGDSDPSDTYRRCNDSFCRQLRRGRVYLCPDACYAEYYNSYFGKSIPVDEGIGIYENSARKIFDYLTTPKEFCSFCKDYTVHKWSKFSGDSSGWNA